MVWVKGLVMCEEDEVLLEECFYIVFVVVQHLCFLGSGKRKAGCTLSKGLYFFLVLAIASDLSVNSVVVTLSGLFSGHC